MNTSMKPSLDGGGTSDAPDDTGSDLDRTSTGFPDSFATEGGRPDVPGDDVFLGDAAPVTALTWLGGAVVNGLVHCACSHHVVHPDLLELATGDNPSLTNLRFEEEGGDAG